VWKTTDGGVTWNQLAATANYFFVNDIVVRDIGTTSELYVAVGIGFFAGWHTNGSIGLFRSTNGGTNFTSVLPLSSGNRSFEPADIEIAANNRIFIGTRADGFGDGGGRILFSDTGNTGSWTTLDFSNTNNADRVELAHAPSNANIIYAVAYNGAAIVDDQDVAFVGKSINGGQNWTSLPIPNMVDGLGAHFTRAQGWYDLILAVHPTNPDLVIIGGIDLHRSINGGTSWSGISHWFGGFGEPYVHADQHALVFRPGSPNELLSGNDGGVHYSPNAGNSSIASPTFESRNKGYNVTQFYSVAARNTAHSNYFLGGTQDNGTQRFSETGRMSTSEPTGGDGGFCFIDQQNSNIQITSFINNNYYISQNGGVSFNTLANNDDGQFINPADYDNTAKILYSAGDNDRLRRITNISGSPSAQANITININGGQISAIRADAFTANRIFIGTDEGRVYRVDNAHLASPTLTNITGTINAGNINSIDIGSTDNELLVVVSNYGVRSVYYTINGGVSWASKDESAHGLPNMSIRWGLFNPDDTRQVILATELGVWSTNDITATNPGWQLSSTGLANVRCDMLQYRAADKMVVVATHGRGIFTSNVFVSARADFRANSLVGYLNKNLLFNDLSTKPTAWNWNFGVGASPATANTVGAHQVQYTTAGPKNVSLTINSNLNETKNNYVHILPDRDLNYDLTNGGNFEVNSDDFVGESLTDNFNFVRGNSATTGKNGVASGSNAWVTNLSDNYPGKAEVRLYTPNFDFSRPGTYTLEFKTKFQTEANFDGFIVEFSTDKGNNWQQLGNAISNNWYNSTRSNQSEGGFMGGTPMFSGTISTYETKTLDISSLAGNTDVAFRFVFKSDEGTERAGVAIDDFRISIIDNTPPTIVNLTPLNNASNVNASGNLIIELSEKVQKNTGNILIRRLSDNTILETIAVSDSRVSVNGRFVTIDPANNLPSPTNSLFFVEIANGALRDLANNNFAGITNNTTWRFVTTIDNQAPQISTLSPNNGAIEVPFATNLVLTMNENIQKNTGNILIRRLSDNVTVETIAITANNASINGAALTINPSNDLTANTTYFVEIAQGAISDLANNNFVGINNNSTWRFTTIENPNSVEDIELANITSLFPNPGNGKFYLNTTKDLQAVEISVINPSGQVVVGQNYEQLIGKNSLDFSQLPNGIYFLKIKTAKGKTYKKFIKQ
jgi:hypothetical protein